jgi:hypothetical protein
MVGSTQKIIADILEIDVKVLRKYYRAELDLSKAKANATIGGALFNKAKGGDTSAMIFWMKTQARWSERHEVDVTTDGQAIPLAINFEVAAPAGEITVTNAKADS